MAQVGVRKFIFSGASFESGPPATDSRQRPLSGELILLTIIYLRCPSYWKGDIP